MVTDMKRLEAAHHKWQRKMLGISWRDKITNETTDGSGNIRGHYKSKTSEMVRTCTSDRGQSTAKAGTELVFSNKKEEKREPTKEMERYSE